jgi:hypothetical protein
MNKFVISEGNLTNLFRDKLLENNWIQRDYNMCVEINNYKGKDKDKDEDEDEEVNSEIKDENIEVEKIDVLFTKNNIKRYYWKSDIKLHNHVMNIQVLTDFFQFYSDLKKKYPKSSKKYTIKSYTYDITSNNYDFDILKKDLEDNLKKNKKYIVKPYVYSEKIPKDKILIGDKILDYVINNKFNCSKWIFMDKIKLSKQTFKIHAIIKMTKKNFYGYIYPNIHDDNNNELESKIINQARNIIKKAFSTEFNKLMYGKYTESAFEILCFDFKITNKNKVKIHNIHTDIEHLNKQKYINDFIDNTLNLVLFNKTHNMKKILKKKYSPFNDEIVESFAFYYCDRIENKMDTIDRLKNNIKNYALEFIYDKPYESIRTIKDRKLINNKYRGKYTFAVRRTRDYKTYNEITNIIIERCNAKCKFGNSKTMLELSNDKNNIKNILISLYEYNLDISYKKVATSIYKQAKMCSYFPINIVYGFIKHFNAQSMLDISTGWGDRLVAACLADVIYYGADPNTCNIPFYNQMIELFGDKNKQKFTTIGFENLEITESYDLIFSSPPFFELEKYSEDKGQSHLAYTTGNSWVYDFLFVCIKKAWKYLNKGGHMCLYMNDYYKLSYCEEMVKFCIENLENCEYYGVIGVIMAHGETGGEIPNEYWDTPVKSQPLWVFHKKN